MEEAVPSWAYEQVAVVDYCPDWPDRAAELAQDLAARLRPWLVGPIEHVGSTAVAGLRAKPIIDLMAGVDDLDAAPVIAPELATAGWHYVGPHLDLRRWRRFFVQVVDDRRSAHLHLMHPDTPRWSEQLRFRDRLRADRALAAGYAALKADFAESHSSDREAYSAAKTDFIAAVVRAPGLST